MKNLRTLVLGLTMFAVSSAASAAVFAKIDISAWPYQAKDRGQVLIDDNGVATIQMGKQQYPNAFTLGSKAMGNFKDIIASARLAKITNAENLTTVPVEGPVGVSGQAMIYTLSVRFGSTQNMTYVMQTEEGSQGCFNSGLIHEFELDGETQIRLTSEGQDVESLARTLFALTYLVIQPRL
jgi:hypothetical protein